jgi:hypothetical protein
MIKLKTRTDTLTKAQKRRVVDATIKWCNANLGVNNRRKNKLTYSVIVQTPKFVKVMNAEAMGMFNPKFNKLIVFHNNNDTVMEMVQTTIHEYTHYLQPIAKYYNYFNKMAGYFNNPFEVEAFNNEKKYYKECWKSIKGSL